MPHPPDPLLAAVELADLGPVGAVILSIFTAVGSAAAWWIVRVDGIMREQRDEARRERDQARRERDEAQAELRRAEDEANRKVAAAELALTECRADRQRAELAAHRRLWRLAQWAEEHNTGPIPPELQPEGWS